MKVWSSISFFEVVVGVGDKLGGELFEEDHQLAVPGHVVFLGVHGDDGVGGRCPRTGRGGEQEKPFKEALPPSRSIQISRTLNLFTR